MDDKGVCSFNGNAGIVCEKHEPPKSTVGEEISNCLSSLWQHTNTHSHRPLCSSSRQSCWETASSWLAPSQSQALLVFFTLR